MSETRATSQSRPRPRARRRHDAVWWLSRWPVLLSRWHLGRLLGSQYVIVTHRGRRSGRVYRTAIMTLRRDSDTGEVIAVAGRRNADWFRNIKAAPPVAVSVGAETYDPHPRFLNDDDIVEAITWSRTHRRRNARVQAMFFRWPWPASEHQLRTLAASLGGVAFHPWHAAAEQSADSADSYGITTAPATSSPPHSDAGPVLRALRRAGLAGPIEYLFQLVHGIAHPHLLRCGATAAEQTMPLPGDDLVVDASYVRTRGQSVRAGPDRVWPWLAQLGAGRGGWPGWYPFVHPHDPAPTQLIPTAQQLNVGDLLREVEGPESSAGWQVAAVQPASHLVLHSCRTLDTGVDVQPGTGTRFADISWAFVLRPAANGTTRLLARTRGVVSPRWYYLLMRPVAAGDTVWQRELIAAVARRAEHATSEPNAANPAG